MATLTLLGTVLRAGEGTWVWRAGTGAAGVVAGRPMEWEWIDVAQSAWFFEGNPRWLDREWGLMMGQNLIRFVPGVLVSLAGVWTGGAWSGALALTWLAWIAACVGVHALYLHVVGGSDRFGAALAALLTAASPGFSAFAGNIDAHQFGYAAAPLALLSLVARRRWVSAGLVLFLANATLELAPPLLAMVWLYHVPGALVDGSEAARARLRDAARITLEFAALQTAWWAMAHVITLGQIVSYNEGLALVTATLNSTARDATPLDLAGRTALLFPASFGVAPVAAGALGLAFLRPSARVWAALWIAIIAGVALATRGHARIVFLAFPALYIAAAAAFSDLARQIGGRLPAPEGAVIGRAATAFAALALALRVGYGDLLGDLSMVRSWWR